MTPGLPDGPRPDVEILRRITVDEWPKPEQTLRAHDRGTSVTRLLFFTLRTLAGKCKQLSQHIWEMRRHGLYIMFGLGRGVTYCVSLHPCPRVTISTLFVFADRMPPIPHSGEVNPVLPVQRHCGDRLQPPRLPGQALVSFPPDSVPLSPGEG